MRDKLIDLSEKLKKGIMLFHIIRKNVYMQLEKWFQNMSTIKISNIIISEK